MSYTKRNCDNCNKEYLADNRNLKRGWGLTCSKSCAAKKREMSRPDYDPETVKINNAIRKGDFSSLSASQKERVNRKRFGVSSPSIVGGSGIVTGITSEGYRIMDGIAYDDFDDEIYGNAHDFDDEDMGWDSHK